MSDRIAALLAMLERGQDSSLLRFSLGNEYFSAANYDEAINHFSSAVELDDQYSAAWKLLGKSYTAADRPQEATVAFERGIKIATANGDRQAAKEMQVFLRRLTNQSVNE